MDDRAPSLPSVGDVIGGKYRVDRVIGKGGMGTVLAVRHLGLDEARALKLMLPRGLELPQARERFFREARAAAKLRSEHAVAVHDVGVLADGFPYIEMELLEGADLAQIMRRGSVSVHSAVDWIAQACEAVGEAHALGIVHRDLKPGNLFLSHTATGREVVKVLDFGIAKTAGGDTDPTLTATNASFGSPVYMSPEQMRGARYASPRSDIWALGVVLFELLTGRRPFRAESVTALALTVTSDPAPRPSSIRNEVPAGVETIVMRCLEKDPAARFSSAGELAAALRASVGLVAPAMRGSLASLAAAPPSSRSAAGASAEPQSPSPRPEGASGIVERASPSGAPTQLVESSRVLPPLHPSAPVPSTAAPLSFQANGAPLTPSQPSLNLTTSAPGSPLPRPAFVLLALVLTGVFGATAALLVERAKPADGVASVAAPAREEHETTMSQRPTDSPSEVEQAALPQVEAPSSSAVARPETSAKTAPSPPPPGATARAPLGRASAPAARASSGFGGID